MKKLHIILIGIFFSVLIFSNIAEAKKVRFFFYGDEILRQEMTHGQVVSSKLCENKIDFSNLNIDVIDTVQQNADDIFVSPNEKYLVFHGAESVKAPWRYFLVDITKCGVVRELGKQHSNKVGSGAFSPDSKKIYIRWTIIKGANSSGVIKEYSGPGFTNERILKNMPQLGRAEEGNGFWYHGYKFSRDGKILLTAYPIKNVWTIKIYDISQDKIITSFPKDSYFSFKTKKYYGYENIPDITKNHLLYNFKTPHGTEVDIFNYNTKKVVSKIINAQKGLGTFSGDGKKVIFSEFPNTTTWKRNVLVYDRHTGSVLGQAVLDEQDDIKDVSPHNKHLIYKRNGILKSIKLH
ncbi:MAG: hypothetical protein M0Z61_04775 [Nitrospiraceae bacterium]|nr:hypothetical protein [Nitrospiraceae bacterium]